MRHHAIWVTSWKDSAIEEAHTRASEIFPWASPISPPTVNNYRSFYVPPDGSKEGWTESEDGDARRAMFIGCLDAMRYDDGSSPLAWVEIQYGDGNGVTRIVNHSDATERNKPDGTNPEHNAV